jgi:hypothetical protein
MSIFYLRNHSKRPIRGPAPLQRSELHCPRGFIVRNNTPKQKSCQSQPTGIYKCKIAISSRDDICLSTIYSIYLRLHVPQVSGYHVAVSAE